MTDVKIKTIKPTDSAGIQKALDETGAGNSFGVVHFSGGNYDIDYPLKLNSGTGIELEDEARLILMDKADQKLFNDVTPIFGQKKTTITDVWFKGGEFDGNKAAQTAIHGKNFHTFIYLQNAARVTVQDMYIHDSQGDGARFKNSSNISVIGNKIYFIGHDGTHCRNCQNVLIDSNDCKLRINSGARILNTSHATISNNVMDGSVQQGAQEWSRGGPGIQIDRIEEVKCEDINVFGNVVRKSYGPGMWICNTVKGAPDQAAGVTIKNNIVDKCGQHEDDINWTGGIVTSGWSLDIEDNTFYKCYRRGIGVLVGNTVQGTAPKSTGYELTVRNNIISETQLGLWNNGEPNGYGIENQLPKTHTVNAFWNDVYKSAKGAFKNVNWDQAHINADPLFTDPEKGDFSLQKGSSCIYPDHQIGRFNGMTFETPGGAQDGGDIYNVIITCSSKEAFDLTKDMTLDYSVFKKVN